MLLLLFFRRKFFDEYNDEEVELTKEDMKTINRLLEGKAPHGEFDPYAVRRLYHQILNNMTFSS